VIQVGGKADDLSGQLPGPQYTYSSCNTVEPWRFEKHTILSISQQSCSLST
jgi:hypothetical protein